MEIKPSELDSVELIGELDGEEIKMIKTVGGLYLAIGRLKSGSKEEVLSAGSHPAIVRYGLEKTYKNFRPVMMKSEDQEPELVSGFSDLLPQAMVDKGYDFYVVKKSNQIDLILTKSQIEVLRYEGHLSRDAFVIGKASKLITSEIAPVSKAATIASAIIATEEGKKNIAHENKKFDAEAVLKKL